MYAVSCCVLGEHTCFVLEEGVYFEVIRTRLCSHLLDILLVECVDVFVGEYFVFISRRRTYRQN